MNIFEPLTTYSSFSNTALVSRNKALQPQLDSWTQKAPNLSPFVMSGRYFFFWLSLPADKITYEHIECETTESAVEAQALAISSIAKTKDRVSMPIPSYSVGIAKPN